MPTQHRVEGRRPCRPHRPLVSRRRQRAWALHTLLHHVGLGASQQRLSSVSIPTLHQAEFQNQLTPQESPHSDGDLRLSPRASPESHTFRIGGDQVLRSFLGLAQVDCGIFDSGCPWKRPLPPSAPGQPTAQPGFASFPLPSLFWSPFVVSFRIPWLRQRPSDGAACWEEQISQPGPRALPEGSLILVSHRAG